MNTFNESILPGTRGGPDCLELVQLLLGLLAEGLEGELIREVHLESG